MYNLPVLKLHVVFKKKTGVLRIPMVSIYYQYQTVDQQSLSSCSRKYKDECFYDQFEYACYTK